MVEHSRLTDERLEELLRLCERAMHGDPEAAVSAGAELLRAAPALITELRALRRVAEAAAVVAVAIDHRLLKQQDLEQLEAALAEWRRVRGLPEREGSA